MFDFIYRLVKGSPLTWSELDGNFQKIADQAITKEALSAPDGSSLVGYQGGSVKDALDASESVSQSIIENQKRTPLNYATFAEAEIDAVDLLDGQLIKTQDSSGKLSIFEVQSGSLVFRDFAPNAISLQSYTPLRSYSGKAQAVQITKPSLSGRFNRDDSDTSTADNGITVIVDGAGRRWKREFSGAVLLSWADGVYDGTADDTEAMRRAYSVANELRVPVSYIGISRIAAQADSQIQLNTDHQPYSCKLTILNGYDPTITTYVDRRKVLFDVFDPSTPLESVNISAELVPERWRKGSVSYFDTLGSGYVSARIPGFRVPFRDDSNTRDLQFTAYLLNGRSNLPLFVDLSGSLTGAAALVRRNSYCPIDLGTLNVDFNGANNQSIYRVRRNGVHLGLRWEKEMVDQNSCCSVIWNDGAGDLNIRELTGPGMDQVSIGTPIATYVLHASGASRIRVNNMWCSKNWAHMGSNRISDFEMKNSTLYRLDVHEDGYDIRASDCRFNQSIQYGLGGGSWEFERIEFLATPDISTYPMIKPRTDYGRTFFGTIECRNFKITCPDDSFVSVFDFLDMGSTQIVGRMPELLLMDGLEINLTPTTSGNPTRTLRIYDFTRSAVSGSSFISPILVDIKNIQINCERDVSARIYINPASSVKPSLNGATLRVRNITSAGNSTLTLNGLSSSYFPGSIKWFTVDIGSIGQGVTMNTNWEDLVLLNYLSDKISMIKSLVITQNPIRFELSNSVIDYVNTSAKTFGPASAYRAYTNFLNSCIIYGDPNLSLINAMQGILVRQYQNDGSTAISVSPTLPSGCTLDTAFTGWKSSSVFK